MRCFLGDLRLVKRFVRKREREEEAAAEAAATPPPAPELTPPPPPSRLVRYFRAMSKAGASDLHLKPGGPPHIRINTRVSATRAEPLPPSETEAMALELLTPKQRAQFEEIGNVDVAFELEGADRFRINVFRQRGQVALAIRRVTREIPDFDALHLPPGIEALTAPNPGLVLVSGPTGSGKSTTLAAVLERINRTRPCHIVTIEDPIEYLYEDKMALVSQREIGIDVATFDVALKYLMREDPDVVLIGEMRDRETFMAALQAAETGHLVFGTTHASSAAQTIHRVLDLLPADMRDRFREVLASNLRAIVCQKLLPCIAPGIDRIPACEILLTNPSVRQLVREGREGDLIEVLRSCEGDGMLTFTTSLLQLIERNYLDPKVAYDVAPNVEELRMRIKGISSSRAGLLNR